MAQTAHRTTTARSRAEPSPAELHREMQAYAAKLRDSKKESLQFLKRIGVMTRAGKLSKEYGG